MSNCESTFLHLDKNSLISSQFMSSASIKQIFIQIHPSQRPPIGKILKELSLNLTSAFYELGQKLCQYSEQSLAKLI